MAARKIRAVPAPASDFPAEALRAVADGLPHMLWAAQPDGAVAYLNEQFVRYTGLSRAELSRRGWQRALHPDESAAAAARWQEALATGRGFEAEVRLRGAEGRYRWHHQVVQPLHDETGRASLWFGTYTDIHERRRAARRLERARLALEALLAARTEALAANDARLKGFLDSMPAIAWIKDSSLRYVWTSASYGRAHRRRPEEMLGHDDFDCWPAEVARRFRRDDEVALRASGPVHCVNRLAYGDGREATWLAIKFPLPDASGALGVAGIAFDIAGTALQSASAAAGDANAPIGMLSARERQVLRLVVDGRTSAEIGARLGLSPKSVDTYRSRLMAKLGIEDLPALVKFALRYGLTNGR